MEWKHYWRNVVKRYMVTIEGWPANIPFRDLSEVSSSLTELETLLRKWHCGKIYWKQLTDTEFQDLDRDRDNQIEGGELKAPTCRRRRSDRGKKRSQVNRDDGTQKRSGRVVVNSDEEEEVTQSKCSTPESED